MVAWLQAMMVVLIILERLGELLLARRNLKWALRQGAREFGARHYPLFFLLHSGWLIGWLAESQAAGGSLSPQWPLWLGLFGGGQVLRYWCIASLGRCWNTRILVIPGFTAVKKGPYRWLMHPNYIAVALELAAVPLVFGAVTTAILATAANAALLLLIRIPEEEQALRMAYGLNEDRS
jgi:methyltransferase